MSELHHISFRYQTSINNCLIHTKPMVLHASSRFDAFDASLPTMKKPSRNSSSRGNARLRHIISYSRPNSDHTDFSTRSTSLSQRHRSSTISLAIISPSIIARGGNRPAPDGHCEHWRWCCKGIACNDLETIDYQRPRRLGGVMYIIPNVAPILGIV